MKKTFAFAFLFAISCSIGLAQNRFTDSLMHQLALAKQDTDRVMIMVDLCTYHRYTNEDSAIFYGKKALSLAKQIHYAHGEANALSRLALALREKGDLPQALDLSFQALKISESSDFNLSYARSYLAIGLVYLDLRQFQKSLRYMREMVRKYKLAGNKRGEAAGYFDLGLVYQNTNLDSALRYLQKAHENIYFIPDIVSDIYLVIGNVQAKKGNVKSALAYYQKAIAEGLKFNDFRDISSVYGNMATLYRQLNQPDSGIYCAINGLKYGEKSGYEKGVLLSSNLLAQFYDVTNPKEALRYSKIAAAAKDSLFGAGNILTIQTLINQQNERQKEVESAKIAYENNLKQYGLIAGLGVFLIIATILYRNNRQKQKVNNLLLQQKEEIEAQARDAQIEVALERVRTKTMAMHGSQDVADTVGTMFDELVKLGVETLRCGIGILDDPRHMEVWTATSNNKGEVSLIIGQVDMMIHPLLHDAVNAWKNTESSFSHELVGEALKDYYRAVNNSADYPVQYDIPSLPSKQIYNAFFFPEGAIFVLSPEALTTEAAQIFKRFAGVFGLTYRRFLDLQKAEAQAREAQVEAALERVRAEAMAMHDSKDVSNATALVFSELYKLGINTIRCGVLIIEESAKLMEVWTATSAKEGKVGQIIGKVDMTVHPLLQNLFKAWQQKKSIFKYKLMREELSDYYKTISKASGNEFSEYYASYAIPDDISKTSQYCYAFFFAEGSLYTITWEPFSQEHSQVLEKFATVFSLTYRRYLDLKQAEEQTREAIIEAALERVRGKAMAMYTSSDLTSIASIIFTELRKLGVRPQRGGFGPINEETRKIDVYAATASDEGSNVELMGWVMLKGNPVLANCYECWLRNEDYFPVLQGEELRAYYEQLQQGYPVLDWRSDRTLYGYFLPFAEGMVYGWTEKPLDENDVKIVKRFTSVIGLTFKRYIELQKSEENTREAVRQASLDRVRAEIASMRSTTDLERITPLVWNELTHLGVPFIRCGVFIIDEKQEQIHSYLSTPDGKAIAAFQLPFNAEGIAKTVLFNWQNKQSVTAHWDEQELKRQSMNLVKQGAFDSEEKYLSTLPKTSLDLHFFPFLQGMLYVGNINPLAYDEKDLVQSLADAFSTAYARYEDFNKLEIAKRQVDKALIELTTAQTQLVQSEKMASLGELTAGIAHEIQNPLNFVNNFSEVNAELIDEMKQEMDKGNLEEAFAIADDIKENEHKITMHGKRADAIVKGMLEHSRSRSGQIEPTDLSVMADEYMRLSYHGLRAKDKSFNAELITHFDRNLPKINVVQQDVGRVLLNLFNNAFYAVYQKYKASVAKHSFRGDDYTPEVTVTIYAENGQVIIKVKDNGVGIPDAIKDKIMQPFFTTKPTGEGTGLGLSLTYDMVVKGHGGGIRVDTKEGQYTEFAVTLPL